MSDIETVIINDHYMILIGITLLFTILGIVRKKLLLSLITTMCWFIVAITYFTASPANSPLLPLAWLYFGLGITFLVVAFRQLFGMFDERKRRRMEGL